MRSNYTALLINLFFISCQAGAFAQNFNVVHHNQNMLGGSGRSVFEQPDGYMMFSVQWSWDSTTSALFAAKFDLEGNFLFEKQYQTNRNMGPGIMDPIALVEQGGYMAAVTLFGGSAPNQTYLYRFDLQGDTLWTVFVKKT